jgi:NADH-quinone oxidoreductase subunit E
MTVEVRQKCEESEVADSHLAFARLADASAKLFAEQAAAVAAMTAFGISVAGQMTGLMLGTLKPAEDKTADALFEHRPMNAVRTDGNVVHLRAKGAGSKAEVSPTATATSRTEERRREPKAKVASRAMKAAPRRSATTAAVGKPAPGVEVARTASKSTPAVDDLKRISGIGPRLEKVLNGRGISTYAQIARLSASALKKIDDELGLDGRVIRDDWAAQAKMLAGGGADATR